MYWVERKYTEFSSESRYKKIEIRITNIRKIMLEKDKFRNTNAGEIHDLVIRNIAL